MSSSLIFRSFEVIILWILISNNRALACQHYNFRKSAVILFPSGHITCPVDIPVSNSTNSTAAGYATGSTTAGNATGESIRADLDQSCAPVQLCDTDWCNTWVPLAGHRTQPLLPLVLLALLLPLLKEGTPFLLPDFI